MDRILKFESDTTEQLTQDLSSYKFILFNIDGNTDIATSARLAIFFHFANVMKYLKRWLPF